jgi:hypothetical protein
MSDKPDWKPGNGLKIERIYAWVAEEPDGGEGVVASQIPGVGWVPLIGADRSRIESYRERAAAVARGTGCKVRLKLFGAGVVIDEIRG